MSQIVHRETSMMVWETPTCHLAWLAQEAYAGSGVDCGPGCGDSGLSCANGCADYGPTGWALVRQEVNPDIPSCVYGLCFGCTSCNP